MFRIRANLIGSVVLMTYCLSWNYSTAQNILPQPELKMAIGTLDRLYFVCKVWEVNEDLNSWNMGYGKKNFWTQFMKGGKFEALAADKIRVVSSNIEAAKNETYAYYKQYAASAIIRGPLYDKGQKTIDRVIDKCEPEPGREAVINIKTVASSEYRKLVTNRDHNNLFLKLYKGTLSNEAIVQFTGGGPLPSDAFARREKVDQIATAVKTDLSVTKAGPIYLENELAISPYDFDKGTFSFPNFERDSGSYIYKDYINSKGEVLIGPTPQYDLIIAKSLLTYKPKSIDEAKKIESARVAGKVVLRTYIQTTGSTFERDRPIIKGSIIYFEALTQKGDLLFKNSI